MKQNVRFVYLEYDEYISQLIYFVRNEKTIKKFVYGQIDDENDMSQNDILLYRQ